MSDVAPNGWPSWVLRGFRDGERRALGEVYRLHAPDVARRLRHGFAFESAGAVHRFVGFASAFELQDALHETFRRAFEPRARDGYDGIRPYAPYLQAIARHVVLRGFRAQRTRFPLAGSEDAAERVAADEGSASPEVVVGREEVRRLVQAFLAELTEEDRRLVTVRFVEGISQRDAAPRLGLGRQQVRAREAKLRRRLVAYLRRHDEAGDPAAWRLLVLLLLLREGISR
jgi:RNA polymerase sigma factor (sigma-70 family)